MTTHKQGPTATGTIAKVSQISLVSKPNRSVSVRITAESQA
jgi:hypothetical protein